MSKLRASWQQSTILEAVLDQHTDALVLFDAAVHITGVNRSAEAMLEMSAVDIIGRRYQDVFRCGGCEGACGIRVGCQEETVSTRTIRWGRQADRNEGQSYATLMYSATAEDLAGAVATFKEVTEQVPTSNQEVVAESPSSRDLLKFVRRVADAALQDEEIRLILSASRQSWNALDTGTVYRNPFLHWQGESAPLLRLSLFHAIAIHWTTGIGAVPARRRATRRSSPYGISHEVASAAARLVKPLHENEADWGFNRWSKAQTGQPSEWDWLTVYAILRRNAAGNAQYRLNRRCRSICNISRGGK